MFCYEEFGEIFPVFVRGGGVVYHPIWTCNVTSITASDSFSLSQACCEDQSNGPVLLEEQFYIVCVLQSTRVYNQSKVTQKWTKKDGFYELRLLVLTFEL
jgi:hypothetical protein